MIQVEHDDDVAIVRWQDGENRFNRASVARWHQVLDELEVIEGPLAVVVVGEGKFFSNGLDLDSFSDDPGAADEVVTQVHRLLGRMLVLPAYTVGALNGHTFAAGAMLASCFDARVMREDRGYWCLPEADLGLPLTPGMLAAVTARLPLPAATEAMNTGRRYGAAEAVAAGLVDQSAPEDQLFRVAVERAGSVAGKSREVIGRHKAMLFGDAARVCGHEVPSRYGPDGG